VSYPYFPVTRKTEYNLHKHEKWYKWLKSLGYKCFIARENAQDGTPCFSVWRYGQEAATCPNQTPCKGVIVEQSHEDIVLVE